jgi:drug/metabolite transporter (DMT)-like permease
MFIGTVFATMGVLASVFSGGLEFSTELLIGATCFGFFSVSFQMLYQVAFSCGPTSITALIASLASIIPLVVSAVVYKEPMSVLNIIGVVLIVTMLVLNADIKKDIRAKNGPGIKWFILIMLAFFANGFGIISQQIYAKATGAANSSTFIALASVIASVIAFSVYLVLRLRGNKISYTVTFASVLPGLAVGAVLVVFQILHTWSLSVIPGTILFPTYSGGASMAIALGSRFIFGEKLSRQQQISLACGMVAIVLINI